MSTPNNNHLFYLSCHLAATNISKKINKTSFFISFVATSKCLFIFVTQKILVKSALFRLTPINVSNAFMLVEIQSVMFKVFQKVTSAS